MPQFLDLPAQADELLAINLGFLKFTQESLIGGFYRLLAVVPTAAQGRQAGIGNRKRLFNLPGDCLKLRSHLVEDGGTFDQHRAVRETFQRLGGQESSIDRQEPG